MENYGTFRKENPDTPYYSFMVTIQNHGPYTFDKYGSSVNFNTSMDFHDEETILLSNYFEGIMDCDRELKNLTDYLDGQQRPIVLVYFGDHMPLINNDFYNKVLPNDEDMESYVKRYTIPYIIWQNSEYKALDDFAARENSRGREDGFSSFYLSAYLFDLLGFGGNNGYFRYVRAMMDEYPVILEYSHKDKTGEFKPNEGNSDIDELKKVEYFKLFDDTVSERQ